MSGNLISKRKIPATTILSGTCIITLAFGTPSWNSCSRSAFGGATFNFSGTLIRWLIPSVYSISYWIRLISAISAAVGEGNAAPLTLWAEELKTGGWVSQCQSSPRCEVTWQYLVQRQKETSQLQVLNTHKVKTKGEESVFLNIMPSYLSGETAPWECCLGSNLKIIIQPQHRCAHTHSRSLHSCACCL